MFVGYLFLFYICYYFSFWSNRVIGSIWFHQIKYIYKFNLNTGLSNRVIRFNLILSCGSTNDPMVRPSTQWLSASAESMTEPSFKLWFKGSTVTNNGHRFIQQNQLCHIWVGKPLGPQSCNSHRPPFLIFESQLNSQVSPSIKLASHLALIYPSSLHISELLCKPTLYCSIVFTASTIVICKNQLLRFRIANIGS